MIDSEIYDLQVMGRCYAYVAEKSEEFMEWWRSTRWHVANEDIRGTVDTSPYGL